MINEILTQLGSLLLVMGITAIFVSVMMAVAIAGENSAKKGTKIR